MSLTYLDDQHNAFNTPWTAERDEALKQLWEQGYSASLIADRLANGHKLTRCAVIGRAHRLKLPARKTGRQPLERKPRRRANGKPRRRPQPKPSPPPRPSVLRPVAPVPIPPTEPATMRRLRLAQLEPHHCRWPLGELMEVAHLFCAADTREGEVYCPHHTWMARPRGKQ
jgi:GcrA cell cycle regulator